jgi:hypothetical protein
MVSRPAIFVGFDGRESAEFAVARESIKRHLNIPIPIYGLVLEDLKRAGLYWRPTEIRPSAADKPIMWDVISDAPMATEHSNARFLVPHIAREGWALFCDGDMLFRGNVGALFDQLVDHYAVYCVKHDHRPLDGVKMDGMVQTKYSRKNWSSFVFFNASHKANKALTVEMVNTVPGRDLHRFCWLEDDSLIGEIGPEWNYLVGYSDRSIKPKNVHFTNGTPMMRGYEDCEFSAEWRDEYYAWARGMLRIPAYTK